MFVLIIMNSNITNFTTIIDKSMFDRSTTTTNGQLYGRLKQATSGTYIPLATNQDRSDENNQNSEL